MKKRLTAVLLSILMVISLMPAAAFADEAENIENEITMEVTESIGEVQEVATMSAPAADSAEVLADWNSSYLNELETKIYNSIASQMEEKAVTGGEMIFYYAFDGMSFDNGGETDTDKLLELADDYYRERIDIIKIYSCLILEYPYEMFWFDKMAQGYGSMGFSVSTSGNTTTILNTTFYMPVYGDYQDKSAEKPKNTLSSSAASKAAQAAAYAQEIVNANAGKSDMEKLQAYKDAICDLASYDLEANEIVGNPDHPLYDTFYGDPFQITSVFDRDPNTKSLCEGYTRAFKYLCDLSDFDSTECYYLIGSVKGIGTSDFIPGGEQNWKSYTWNIVKTEGKSYLVDVTNCDTGTFGEPDYVFMKEPTRGNLNDGYWFNGAKGSEIHYSYASAFLPNGILDTTILDLNGRYMTGSISLSGTPKIGETLKVDVKGAPTFSTIQWYRDDTPISGATGNTYTLSSGEDVGKTIKVVVSASGCEGTLTAQTSEAVTKANPEPVNDIKILEVTDTSITIQTNPGEVYACVDVSESVSLPTEEQWGTSGEFTGLSAGKVYAVFARRSETDTHYGTPTTGYKFEVVTTSAEIIMRVEVSIDDPVKYQELPSATVHTTNMTATLAWYEGQDTTGEPVTGKAKPNQYYTAKLSLKADDGYKFGKGCFIKVNNTTAEFPLEGQSVMTMNIKFMQPTAPVELTNIEITKQPDKTSYIDGEKFDPTGMTVTAYYDDGTNKAVDLSECTFTPETLTGGMNSVTVSYGGKTASVPVTVSVPVEVTSIEVTKQPDKTEYKEDESFDPTGMEIKAKYSDGSSGPVSVDNCTFSPEKLEMGVTSVTISYKGKTASVPVTVSAAELTSIEVTKQPDKIEYFDGDSFDPTGMEITASYDNGLKKPVSIDDCTFSPKKLTIGVTSVTVNYNGKTASVPVTVNMEESTPKYIKVGDTNIITGDYWTSSDGITWTKYESGIPEDNYVYYNTDNNTLTLHNAVIHGKGIDVFGLPHKSVSLTIILEGENIISEARGISVFADSYGDTIGKNATLTIEGPGSLTVESKQDGITLYAGTGNATLNINNASVKAIGSGMFGVGICIISSSYAEWSELTVNINNSILTAIGGDEKSSIRYVADNNGVALMNISGNSILNAVDCITAIPMLPPIPKTDDDSVYGGIVFDGNEGTVYGDVELQEDLVIEEGKTLTIPENSSLNTNGKNIVVEAGGKLEGEPTGTGSVKYAPTITTESLTGGNVGASYEQQLNATGDPAITWSITEGSLPEGISLDANTGIISGKPAAKGTYTFTVTASNSIGSHSREFSIEVTEPEYELGDVNMDGKINILDATAIQQYLVGISGIIFNESVADYNNDGVVSILDATAIQKKLVGLD